MYTQGGDAKRQGEGKMDGESGNAETGKAQRERQEADCPIRDAEECWEPEDSSYRVTAGQGWGASTG